MTIKTSTEDMLHVFQWKNGDKEWSPFSDAEMDRRQNAMRRHMAAQDIDAAVFTSYHGICYYSGFLYCYFGRKYGFVLTQDSATTVTAGIDGGQPWRRSHGDNIIYSDWRRDNFFTALKSLIPAGAKRIGIEFDHVSLDYRRLLGDAFPGVEFVDVAAASMWMRTIKSDEEIKLIREGTRICNVGARAVMDAVEEGVPEYEVALASTQAMVREIGKSFPFVELMDTWTWFQSGIMTDGAHNPVTNKRVARGDILSLNCFPMIFGYYTAIERTLFCEEASDAHLDLWQKNCAVMKSRLRHDRAGPEMLGDRAGAQRDVSRLGPVAVPVVRLRPFLRGAVALLRPRGRRGAARGRRHGAGAGHGRLDGADDHDPGRHAGRRRLPRARHLRRHRGRRGEHHQLSLRAGRDDHPPLGQAPNKRSRCLQRLLCFRSKSLGMHVQHVGVRPFPGLRWRSTGSGPLDQD
jgi:creatinase